MRRAVAVVACVLLLATAAGAASGSASDRLVVAISEDVSGFDPNVVTGAKSSAVWRHVYGSLLKTDASRQPVPDLAVSYKNVDDLVWRFNLRQGVKFHNGEPFTADDVVFTLNRLRQSSSPYARDYALIDRIKVIDPHTIDIVTSKPWPDLPLQISGLQIVPRKGSESLAQNPVGTGPYRLAKWVRDEYILLEAFKDYWGGPPPTQEVQFRIIPEAATQVAALLAGEVDVLDSVPNDAVARLKRDPKVRVYAGRTLRVVYVGFDTTVGGPLSNVRVRQALNYAINVEMLVEHVLSGFGHPVATLACPGDFGYDPSVSRYPYDPQKARSLLAEAGYPDGFSVKFQAAMGDWMPIEVAEAVASQLKAVGVRADLVQVEKGLHIDSLLKKDGDPPMFMLSLGGATSRLQSTLDVSVHSTGRYSYYANPELDALLDAARVTVSPERRSELYSKIQRFLKEQAPMVFLYEHYVIFAASARVQNWQPRADGLIMVDAASLK